MLLILNYCYYYYYYYHHPCYHLYVSYSQLYATHKPCPYGTHCCSCSVFTVCATCNVTSPVQYVLYLYISTSSSLCCSPQYGCLFAVP